MIRDESGYYRHADYIHYNPLKHTHVQAVKDLQYCSINLWVKRELYLLGWTTVAYEIIDVKWEY